jgi:thiol:disulfide interchange protein DsbA
MKRSLLLLFPVMMLAACQQAAPAGDAASAAAASGSASATPSAEAQAAAASAAAAAGAAAQAASPDAPSQATADATEPPATPPSGLTPGVDYVEIPGGQPFDAAGGKVEVVEVFNYICPACARFEPMFNAWVSQQPADVRVTYLPAPFNVQWVPYARAFYVADAMGLVPKTHQAVFQAIHIDQTLPGEGKKPDEEAVAAWYGKHGADPQRFLADMHSFGTDAKIKRGLAFMTRSGVSGTPTLIVDGKYRALGRSYEDMLRITTQLVAMERAAKAGGNGAER